MKHYILNKRSGILHTLPASESCNTDQIAQALRFEIHATEVLIAHVGHRFTKCRRCFRDPD